MNLNLQKPKMYARFNSAKAKTVRLAGVSLSGMYGGNEVTIKVRLAPRTRRFVSTALATGQEIQIGLENSAGRVLFTGIVTKINIIPVADDAIEFQVASTKQPEFHGI